MIETIVGLASMVLIVVCVYKQIKTLNDIGSVSDWIGNL